MHRRRVSNKDQNLPLESNTVDICLMVAAWQYLQWPEDIANEIKRVIRPKGKLIISFSNRAFWTKASRVWVDGSYEQHFECITSILVAQGWDVSEYINSEENLARIFGLFRINRDPFYSVIATA